MSDQMVDALPPATAPGEAPPPQQTTRGGSSKTQKKPSVARWVATWDWHTHPPVWTTVNVAVALLWASWLGYQFEVHFTIPVIIGAIGACGALGSGMVSKHEGPRLWWRIVCWVVPAGWAIFAVEFSPWQPAVLAVGAAVAVAFGVIARAVAKGRKVARSREEAKAAAGLGIDAAALRTAPATAIWNADNPQATNINALAVNWRARIKRVTGLVVTIPNVAHWKQGTGYTLKVRMPLGGQGWKALAGRADELANDAGLPEECGVSVTPGKGSRSLALVKVMHVNRMADEVPVELDYSPLSIYDKLTLGFMPDGGLVSLMFKWVCAVVTGQTGSGKSATLNLLNFMFARCTDTVIWHIDVGGGGAISRPWVAPWHEDPEKVPHPVIDWPATTEAEAELILRAADAIGRGRKRAYAKQMRKGKIHCTPKVPHIVIVMDEFGSLPERLHELAVKVSDTYRAAGVRLVTCGLRGTAEYIPVALKKQARIRIGMRIDDPEEINYLHGWDVNADINLAPYEGSGWLHHQETDEDNKPVGPKYLTPWKAHYLDEDIIESDVAPEVARLRPVLDDASMALADSVGNPGRNYSNRWDRCLPALFADAEETEEDGNVVVEPSSGNTAKDERCAQLEAEFDAIANSPGSSAAALERMQELGDQLRSQFDGDSDVTASQSDTDTVKTVFSQIAEGLGELGDNDDELALLQIIDDAGASGIKPAEMLKQLQQQDFEIESVKTVHRRLKVFTEDGSVVKIDKKGTYVGKRHYRREGP